MKAALLQFWRDEQGVTAIEYGLIAVLIAAAVIGAVADLGSSVSGMYAYIKVKIVAALS